MGTLLLIESPFLLALAAAVWGLCANQRTYRDRMWLADRIFALDVDGYSTPLKMYENVDYNQHFWKVFWLRNPWEIYDQTVFRLINAWPKGHVPKKAMLETA